MQSGRLGPRYQGFGPSPDAVARYMPLFLHVAHVPPLMVLMLATVVASALVELDVAGAPAERAVASRVSRAADPACGHFDARTRDRRAAVPQPAQLLVVLVVAGSDDRLRREHTGHALRPLGHLSRVL